jgi:hypothetical protein
MSRYFMFWNSALGERYIGIVSANDKTIVFCSRNEIQGPSFIGEHGFHPCKAIGLIRYQGPKLQNVIFILTKTPKKYLSAFLKAVMKIFNLIFIGW